MSELSVTHKLTRGKKNITGDEDITMIDAWIKEIETDLEIIMPGAKQIMVDAQAVKSIIDASTILGYPNAAAARRLSREPYVIFAKKKKKRVINTKGLVQNADFEREARA